jgi:hypothetical protein
MKPMGYFAIYFLSFREYHRRFLRVMINIYYEEGKGWITGKMRQYLTGGFWWWMIKI